MRHQTELEFAKQLAKESGMIMQKYFKTQELGHSWKPDHTPLTIADTTINSMVINRIKEAFPEHGVLGEEESFEPDRQMVWVVDPIDGTVPFSLGIPTSAFSMALVDRADGQQLIAVTYDPFLDELFYASKGGGAFVNDQKLQTSQQSSLKRSYMCMSTRNGKGEGYEYDGPKLIGYFRDQGVMMLNYMSMVYPANRVAAGQILALASGWTDPWDAAACTLLIQEAGGIVTNLRGEKRRFDEAGDGYIMAANQEIFDIIVKQVKTG